LKAFRIHALDARSDGCIPYVSAKFIDETCVQFGLGELDSDLDGTYFSLSKTNLYGLLEGKSMTVDLPFMVCTLTPTDRELRVDVEIEGAVDHRSYALALGELALAWNLMSAGPSLL